MKTASTVLDPAMIRNALVGTERELVRLVDSLMRSGVSLVALRGLLAYAPETPQVLPVELAEAISLLRAAETVLVSACNKIHGCSEELPFAPSPPFEAALAFSGSEGFPVSALMPGADREQ